MEKWEALCKIDTIKRENNEYLFKITSKFNACIKQEKYSAKMLMTKYEHLLDYFSAKDLFQIYSIASNNSIPIIEKPVLPKYLIAYLFLLVLQLSIFVSANLLSSKIMHVWGINIVAGAICFPLTYSISSIIVELFGFKKARISLFFSIMANTIIILCLQLGKELPPSELWLHQTAFATVVNNASRLFFASTTAILMGDLTNCYLLSYLKEQYPAFNINYRLLLTSLIGLFLDSIIFITLAHANTLNAFAVLNMLFNILFHKFTYEVATCLFIGFIIKKIQTKYPEFYYEALELNFLKTKI